MAAKKDSEKTEVVYLQSMDVRAIGGNPKECVKLNKSVYMGRIYGVASDLVNKLRKDTTEYTILIGMFAGIGSDGTQYESERLILPGAIMENTVGALKAAGGASIKIAYDIYASPDEKSSPGFKYAAKSLIKAEAYSVLGNMVAEMSPLPNV